VQNGRLFDGLETTPYNELFYLVQVELHTLLFQAFLEPYIPHRIDERGLSQKELHSSECLFIFKGGGGCYQSHPSTSLNRTRTKQKKRFEQ